MSEDRTADYEAVAGAVAGDVAGDVAGITVDHVYLTNNAACHQCDMP